MVPYNFNTQLTSSANPETESLLLRVISTSCLQNITLLCVDLFIIRQKVNIYPNYRITSMEIFIIFLLEIPFVHCFLSELPLNYIIIMKSISN